MKNRKKLLFLFSKINIIFLNNIYKNRKFLTLIVFEVVVHIKTLLFMQFSYELLNISIKHRLYLILQHYLFRSTHFHYQQLVVYSPQEGQSLKFLLFGAYLLIIHCISTQDLTLCHLTNFFCFRCFHAHVYFIVTLQLSQLQGCVPAIHMMSCHGFAMPCTLVSQRAD